MKRSQAPACWHTGASAHGLQHSRVLYTAPSLSEQPQRLRSSAQVWRRERTGTRGRWMAAIAQHLADGGARTFHRICVELTGYGSHANYLCQPDHALWELVRTRQVEHTLVEPMLFRRRAS